MAHFTLVAVLALLASVSVAQQYNGNNGNYVDNDYDYDNGQPASRPASPPQRSYSRPPPPPVRSSAPAAPRPTPVPILKQINKHNEDGSYTYGYEGADGSFKIETKLNTGEVMGKYGYVDDAGKVRVVEYGANRYGFQPSGEGITVAPPTLVDETKRRPGEPEYDDGQYYEQAAPRAPAARPQPQLQLQRPAPRPAPQPPRPAHQQLQQAQPAPPPQQQYSSFDSYQEEPQYRPAPQAAPQPRVSQGPAPPRLQVPGAAPAGGIVYSQQPQQLRPSGPAPPRPVQQHQAPVYHAQPLAAPAPPPPPAPRPAPRPAPQTRQAGGLLDQLARDYALPQGGHALHDISFGYYS